MFNLTRQERQVILFFISMALVGLGINFARKFNPRLERVVQVNNDTTKIALNQANLEDFLGLGCISPKLAQRIIEYRNQNGPFRQLEELKEVKGIGDYRYEKLKDLFFLN